LDLKVEFDKFYESRFGKQELLFRLFYSFPIGIRFEIGKSNTRVYDEEYVKNACRRAITIFSELFDNDDTIFVVVNSFEDDPNDLAGDVASDVLSLISHQNKCKFPFNSQEEEDFSCTRHIVQTFVKDIQIEKLIENIIWSDIDGRNNLKGCVYFINPKNNIIYWLYDDRGLDVISNEKTNLNPIYIKFNSWILNYDREKIDRVFA